MSKKRQPKTQPTAVSEAAATYAAARASALNKVGVHLDATELDAMFLAAASELQAGLQTSNLSELTKGEIEILESGGFRTRKMKSDPDLIGKGIAEYTAMMATARTVRETAELVGVNESRIRQRLNGEVPTLDGIHVGREWRVPAFQFNEASRCLLPGLDIVVAALDPALHPLTIQSWFLQPNPDLADSSPVNTLLSPREWLLHDLPPDPLADLARFL